MLLDIGQLPLRGQISLNTVTDTELTYLWILGGHETTITITEAGATLAASASPVQVAMLQAAISGDEPPWHGPARVLFNRVEPLVGTPVTDWAAADFMKVMTLFLWDKKALDNDLKLRHPRDWVKRRPGE